MVLKWDVIHCILGTDCVQVQNRKARDCLFDRTPNSDVQAKCQKLMTSLMGCRNSQLNNRHRLKGKRGHHDLAMPNMEMFSDVKEN